MFLLFILYGFFQLIIQCEPLNQRISASAWTTGRINLTVRTASATLNIRRAAACNTQSKVYFLGGEDANGFTTYNCYV